MKTLTISDEDAKHLRDWQRLSSDEKEALTEIAKIFRESNKRTSLRSLIADQVKISDLLTTASHISWAWQMFMKGGVVAGVIISVMGAYKLFFGGK